MYKLRKHIAYLLLGIFIFPVVFRPIHVIGHHIGTSEIRSDLGDFQLANDNLCQIGEIPSEKEDICAICNYHFSLNDLVDLFLYKTEATILNPIYRELSNQLLHKQIFSKKTPRAPPISLC